MSSPAMMTTTLGSRSSGAIPRADASSPAVPRRDEPDGLRRVQTSTSSATAMSPIMSAKPRKRYGVGVLHSPGCAPWPAAAAGAPATPTSASPSLIGLMMKDESHGCRSPPLSLFLFLCVCVCVGVRAVQSGFSLVLCGCDV
ncbi:hypothetical protein VPH35_130704 [Triticum aestivum]